LAVRSQLQRWLVTTVDEQRRRGAQRAFEVQLDVAGMADRARPRQDVVALGAAWGGTFGRHTIHLPCGRAIAQGARVERGINIAIRNRFRTTSMVRIPRIRAIAARRRTVYGGFAHPHSSRLRLQPMHRAQPGRQH
jgi:hypothetical protein